MNREMLQKHLEQAEEHIARSERHIVDQRALIARLEREGYADQAAEAKELLAADRRMSLWNKVIGYEPAHVNATP